MQLLFHPLCRAMFTVWQRECRPNPPAFKLGIPSLKNPNPFLRFCDIKSPNVMRWSPQVVAKQSRVDFTGTG
ncbi:protein of unknown function [Aminobacter niigataensis]|nr:protein of unknown function [Aminobacter niigataensis]